MRRYRYDLHTHSCLSPCGDNDMTPNNLVNMAALLGCEILAVTDHNTCRNAPAAVRVGEAAGVLVIPGMELCTAEEAHVVCLFETVEAALAFDEYVAAHTMHIPNRPEIFGEQLILNERDEEIGRIDRLLITATEISVNDVQALVASYGGVAFPAHVDKDAYSVTAALGAIPPEAGFRAAELSGGADRAAVLRLYPELQDMILLRDSDAHYLHLMQENMAQVELPARSIEVYGADLIAIDTLDGVPVWTVAFDVSKGTYIRSLARDLGRSVGGAAHLCDLRRTASGCVNASMCLTAEDLTVEIARARCLDPVQVLGLSSLEFADDQLADVLCGRLLRMDFPDDIERFALLNRGELRAIAVPQEGRLRMTDVFPQGIEGAHLH